MTLDLEEIKRIALGAVSVTQNNGRVLFSRFTQRQEELYKNNSRHKATAGVRLCFRTDSKTLKMAGEVIECTSRTYFSFDIFVNGKMCDCIDNFSQVDLPLDYSRVRLPLGGFAKEIDLGGGCKDVCIYFPWSVCPVLEEISLDDGSFVEPIKPKKKLLAFGDSITQGYDSLRPSMSYVSLLADKLRAEELNKGIGGEVFFPALAQTKEDFTPDFITVAYGTNDFSKRTEDDFKERCKDFYTAISQNYPDSDIFAITPIWRSDYTGKRAFGPFENVEADIRDAVSQLQNITVISGFDLVPQSEKYFSDLRLHPNDKGFEYYAENLYNKIKRTF